MMTKQEELATKKDLKKLEDTLTVKVDANGNKIDQVERNLSAKIDANATKIDQVEKNLSAKIDANSAKIDANSATLSNLTTLALENQADIKMMMTRDEFNRRFDEVVSGIDGLARSFSILEQEKVVINNRLDRIETRLG